MTNIIFFAAPVIVLGFFVWMISGIPPQQATDPAYDDIYSYHDVCREKAESIGYTYVIAERHTGILTGPDENCYGMDKEGVVRQLY